MTKIASMGGPALQRFVVAGCVSKIIELCSDFNVNLTKKWHARIPEI